MKIFSLLAVFTILISSNAFGQASLVRNRLQAVALGKGEDVKRELPDILAEFPDDPGVQFLHGVVLEDAARALKIYEKIVKEHPECEWADDSQWRIVQFYSLRKDTTRARKELKTYREKYPQSEFLLNASEMVKATVGFPKVDKVTTAPTSVTEAKAAVPEPKLTPKPAGTNPQPDGKVSAKTTVAEPKTPAKPSVTDPKAISKAAPESKPVAKSVASDAKSAKPKTPETKPGAKPKTPETKLAVKPSSTESKLVAKPSIPETKPSAKPAVPESKLGAKAEPKESSKDVFSLQVGSYDTREAAENEVKNYKLKRMRASVTEKTIDGATKFAVFIGEYSSKESAEKAKELVQKSCNCTPFVVGK